MTALLDTPLSDAGAEGLGLPDQCPRHDWCLSPAGHRGGCRRYPAGDPRSKKSSSSSRGSSKRPGAPRTSSAAPARRARSSVWPSLWSMLWGQAGQVMEWQGPEPAAPAVGRVMQFQAPLAGERMHNLANKLPIYRQATALAGGGLLDDVLELVAAPLLVAVMATNESAQMTLAPLLAGTLQKSAVAIAKAQKQQRDAMEAVSEYDAEASAIMEEMLGALFAPRPHVDEQQPGPDGA